MRRIYHPYEGWEDWRAGMWARAIPPTEEDAMLASAVEFTGNAKLYGKFMLKVVKRWPIASEHNLTNTSLNRRAWVGHAAASLAIGAPEYITRRAWWLLTQRQRDKADRRANAAIRKFEERMRSERWHTVQLSLF